MKRFLLSLLFIILTFNILAQNKHQGAVVIVDGVLFSYNSNTGFTLVKYPDNKTDASYTIPSSLTYTNQYTGFEYQMDVTTIASGAFSNPHLRQITLPSTINNIYEHAFINCTALTEFVYTRASASAPSLVTDNSPKEVVRYNLQGQQITPAEKGIQIIVYSDYHTETLINE